MLLILADYLKINMLINKKYINIIKKRTGESHVYKKFQFTGLIIAQLLNDEKHKSLYIKLAKEYDNEKLLNLAKDISERKKIENKGGYFMKVFTSLRKDMKIKI